MLALADFKTLNPQPFYRSRLCLEQRPLKREEGGSFITEAKASEAAEVGAGASRAGEESDMDDGRQPQHHPQSSDQRHGHDHRDMCGAGEERLVESLGAVAINKRRRVDAES